MIVLITGASSGFGAEMARKFIKEGHKVIACARRFDKLKQLQDELGCNLLAIKLDVSDAVAIQKMLAELPQDFTDINVLINNAGLALGIEPAHQTLLSDWETMIDTNIKGLVNMTHAILPLMSAKKEGLIINIGSIAGSYAYPGGNVYGGTKAFVKQFSLNLRADLADLGIRVSNIEPGLVGTTEFSNVRFKGDDAKAHKIYENADALTAKDIAESAYWIATQPKHVNINRIEIMPVCQAFSGLTIHRHNNK